MGCGGVESSNREGAGPGQRGGCDRTQQKMGCTQGFHCQEDGMQGLSMGEPRLETVFLP